MGFIRDIAKRLNANAEYVSGKGTLYRQSWAAPAAPANTGIHAAVTLPATGTTVVTTGITNPVTPRVARIKGNASGIAGNVLVTGKDQFGVTKTDTIALSGASAVDGVIAFKSVMSITFPAKTNSSGDTCSVGLGAALGLDRHISVPVVFGAAAAGVVEATAPVMDATNNTIAFNTAADGTKSFVAYYPHEDLSHA